MFRQFRLLCVCYVLIFVLPLNATPVSFAKPGDQISIPFGSASKIVFDTKAKTYNVFSAGIKIISNAYSLVKNNRQSITSKDYDEVKPIVLAINDGFGDGKKYTIVLSKPGLPSLEQVFYVYPGHEYFLTEVSLKGTDLKSNYMSPLVSNEVNISANGENRTLFVPFDNDTFIRYNAKSMNTDMENTSSEVGAVYENQSRKGLILGSVEHMVWKTGVFSKGKSGQLTDLRIWGGYSDEKVTRDKIEHGYLSGNVIKSPKVFVGYFADWRKGMEAYGKANRIQEVPYVFNWTKPVPFGWNSWGVIQEKLTFEKATKVVDFFADEIPAFRNGQTAYIDLDSFWDNFTGGMKGDYGKLKEFADYCKSKGLEPGVYWAPFTDWGFKSTRDREAEGSKYKFSEMWTKVNGLYHDFDGARALDPTHPGTLRRVDYIVDKLKTCGFKMIKIDFLGHAAAESDIFYDKSVTTGMQAYKMGMEYLVNRLDGQMLIYAAISPGMATGRYAHVRRIACDAWKTIKDTEYTLNSVNYGWWQTYVYNYIDADHVVFGAEIDRSNKARLTSSLITGTLITGDDFSADGKWNDAAKKWLQNPELLKISASGKAFMPVEGNTGDKATEVFMRLIEGEVYVALFNFGNQNKEFNITLDRLGLKGTAYNAKELFSNQSLTIGKAIKVDLMGSDAAIIKFKIK
ncbi:alpha-galactosidase [Pedobacter psychroterrae]|uniref:Alpha-galactosidase n=1 Tax=Pedobacter psychroterrae TaxID=2530453 RepID=A0A4R0NB96_9SPHI|nr:alpha-galactosidase [Pedobacter psychroterrae]TCC97445.1 alpha-galactosidase [Pedobacter psychroterrae]